MILVRFQTNGNIQNVYHYKSHENNLPFSFRRYECIQVSFALLSKLTQHNQNKSQ